MTFLSTPCLLRDTDLVDFRKLDETAPKCEDAFIDCAQSVLPGKSPPARTASIGLGLRADGKSGWIN